MNGSFFILIPLGVIWAWIRRTSPIHALSTPRRIKIWIGIMKYGTYFPQNLGTTFAIQITELNKWIYFFSQAENVRRAIKFLSRRDSYESCTAVLPIFPENRIIMNFFSIWTYFGSPWFLKTFTLFLICFFIKRITFLHFPRFDL